VCPGKAEVCSTGKVTAVPIRRCICWCCLLFTDFEHGPVLCCVPVPLPGSMSIRYQPYGVLEPQCFLDVKANPRVRRGGGRGKEGKGLPAVKLGSTPRTATAAVAATATQLQQLVLQPCHLTCVPGCQDHTSGEGP
jgi:hypothetical protein